MHSKHQCQYIHTKYLPSHKLKPTYYTPVNFSNSAWCFSSRLASTATSATQSFKSVIPCLLIKSNLHRLQSSVNLLCKPSPGILPTNIYAQFADARKQSVALRVVNSRKWKFLILYQWVLCSWAYCFYHLLLRPIPMPLPFLALTAPYLWYAFGKLCFPMMCLYAVESSSINNFAPRINVMLDVEIVKSPLQCECAWVSTIIVGQCCLQSFHVNGVKPQYLKVV